MPYNDLRNKELPQHTNLDKDELKGHREDTHTFHSWWWQCGPRASPPRPWSGWWGWWCARACTWSASPRWLAGSKGPLLRSAHPARPPCAMKLQTPPRQNKELTWIRQQKRRQCSVSFAYHQKGSGSARVSCAGFLEEKMSYSYKWEKVGRCLPKMVLSKQVWRINDYPDRRPSARTEPERIPAAGPSAVHRTISAPPRSAWNIDCKLILIIHLIYHHLTICI